MVGSRERIFDVLSGLVAVVAIVVAILVGIRRFDRTPHSISTRDFEINGWERYADAGHRVGPEFASVTIVLFSDYQCPACRRFFPHLDHVLNKYASEVSVVHRHWPISSHELAYPAALAAECAADQGRFWAFHRLLMKDSTWLQNPDQVFQRFADSVSVGDRAGFEWCIRASEPRAEIKEDILAAQEFSARGTPAILVNGIYLGGTPDSLRLESYLLDALGRVPPKGLPPS